MSAIQLNDKRQLLIDLNWLLDGLSADEKRNVADHLACHNDIIEDVAAQLLTGWTERSSHGAVSCSADPEPATPLDKARRELASRAGEVAVSEIEALKRALVWERAVSKHYQDAYFAAYHAWDDRNIRQCPHLGPVPISAALEYEVVRKGAI